MADPPRISVAELADGAAGFPRLDDSGLLTAPLAVVRLDDQQEYPPDTWPRAAAHAAACPRLLIGLTERPPPAAAAELLRALDVTLIPETAVPEIAVPEIAVTTSRTCLPAPDPQAALTALAEAAHNHPRAAVVLRQVLRATESLPVRAALDVESLAYSTLLGGPEFRAWLAGQPPRPLPPPAADPVLIRRKDPSDNTNNSRLRITLNRPERRNAYGRQLRDALTDALRVARLDPSVTEVTLNGAGPCFCSGGDLAEFGTAPDPVTAHFVRTQGGAALLLHALRDKAQVRVHGPCTGAGVELPAFAATVTAAPGTTFRLPEVAMGLIPGAGGTVSIPRRIGRWRTLYLALAGHPLDAATALAWGLIDKVDAVDQTEPPR